MDTSHTVIVWAGLRVKDGLAEEFKKLVAPVIAATLAESGCIRYDLLQDSSDPCSFFYFEEYVDAVAYQAHRAMPYMEDFRPKREKLLDHFLGLRILSEIDK